MSWLDDASHTVRLAIGAIFDGIRNGNMLTPAVAMMPKIPSALAMKANPDLRPLVSNSVSSGPATPIQGARIIQGWVA